MKPKPETERDLVDALAEAFEHAEADLSIEEVDEELRAGGLNPEAVGARLAAVAEQAYRQSPYNWRQRAAAERAEADRRLREKLAAKRLLSREETLREIQAITSRSSELRAQAHFRNFEHATDEDLAGLLADLQLLEETASEDE